MNASIQITALVRQQAVIPYADFPHMLKAHLDKNKNTQAIELSGYALRTCNTMRWADIEVFVKKVCAWGGYSGISGRVLKRNSSAEIAKNVNAAISKLSSSPPDLVGALKAMMEIKGLGLSFASKHMRFLFPEYCPVLDSVLSNRLLFELSPDGYKLFSTACKDISHELNGANIICPFPGKSSWRPSDVEAALYAWANEWV